MRRARRIRAAYMPTRQRDDLAAANRSHHRRSFEREERSVGLVCRSVGCRACGRQAACGQSAAVIYAPTQSRRQSRFSTPSSAFQLLREFRSGDAVRAARSAPQGLWRACSPTSRRVACPPWCSTSRRAISISIRATPRSPTAMRTSPNSSANLRAGPQWKHMVIVITYDEYRRCVGSPRAAAWRSSRPRHAHSGIDRFAVREKAGPWIIRTTIPRSILRLIIRRFDLAGLPGIALRDQALDEHGEPPMGDLTNALDLPR